MEIAYIIRAHKYPEQLVRLINKLDSPKTSFIVHVNQKIDKKHILLWLAVLAINQMFISAKDRRFHGETLAKLLQRLMP